MLSAAQTNALGSVGAGHFGILGCVCIGHDAQAAGCVHLGGREGGHGEEGREEGGAEWGPAAATKCERGGGEERMEDGKQYKMGSTQWEVNRHWYARYGGVGGDTKRQ